MSTTVHHRDACIHNNKLKITRVNHSKERSIFRATKELCRFITTTIVVANASKCTTNAASIMANYHKTFSARTNRMHRMNRGGSVGNFAENNVNLWHFRTFSTCQASPSCLSLGEEDDHEDISKGRRSRRSSHRPSTKDMSVVASTSSKAVRRRENINEALNDNPPTAEELKVMRAKLGPVGRAVADSVDLGFTVVTSYLTGGAIGYIFSGMMGTPGLFLKNTAANGAAAQVGRLKGIQGRIGNLNTKALTSGKSWGSLNAAFSGFNALARTVRGGKEDRWNNIFGSACTGAYLNRAGGPQAMLQGASSYAGFTYLMDFFLDGKGKGEKNVDREFDYKEIPMEDRGY